MELDMLLETISSNEDIKIKFLDNKKEVTGKVGVEACNSYSNYVVKEISTEIVEDKVIMSILAYKK